MSGCLNWTLRFYSSFSPLCARFRCAKLVGLARCWKWRENCWRFKSGPRVSPRWEGWWRGVAAEWEDRWVGWLESKQVVAGARANRFANEW